jgi:hypothetical protein
VSAAEAMRQLEALDLGVRWEVHGPDVTLAPGMLLLVALGERRGSATWGAMDLLEEAGALERVGRHLADQALNREPAPQGWWPE